MPVELRQQECPGQTNWQFSSFQFFSVAWYTAQGAYRLCVCDRGQVSWLLRDVAGEVPEQDERHHSAPLARHVQPKLSRRHHRRMSRYNGIFPRFLIALFRYRILLSTPLLLYFTAVCITFYMSFSQWLYVVCQLVCNCWLIVPDNEFFISKLNFVRGVRFLVRSKACTNV